MDKDCTKIKSDNITKMVIGFLWTAIFTVIVILGQNVIANETKRVDSEKFVIAQISDLRVTIAEMRGHYTAIENDLIEIKGILKRNIGYVK